VDKRLICTHLSLSMTDELKEKIGSIAYKHDMSVSAYCRQLIRKEVERYEKTEKDNQ
jgi:predicted transcriptional regulator